MKRLREASAASVVFVVASVFAATVASGAPRDRGGQTAPLAAGSGGSGGAGGYAGRDHGGKAGSDRGGAAGSKSDERPATCEDTCDRTAAVCVDACEEAHKGKPLPRITCKLGCADKRHSCAEACPR